MVSGTQGTEGTLFPASSLKRDDSEGKGLGYREVTNMLVPCSLSFWASALSPLSQANFSRLEWICPLRLTSGLSLSFIGSNIFFKELSVIRSHF